MIDKSKVATSVVSSVVAALITALAFYFLGLLAKAPRIIVPSRSVVAFNLAQCPPGWSPFEDGAGRVVVGVGEAPDLTIRTLREKGGLESVTLSIQQMPRHRHDPPAGAKYYLFNAEQPNNDVVSNPFERRGGWWSQSPSTEYEGGDGAHDNMPPFVALLLCERN